MFGLRKSISGKYFIFRKCYFPERKTFSCVWLSQNSFYGKLISVFGSFKHFYRKCIKSGKRNQNPTKENESTTSNERCDRRSTSSAIAVRRATSSAMSGAMSNERRAVRSSIDERACRTHTARRSTSDAIVRTIAPRDLIDCDRRSCRSSARSTIGALRSGLSLLSLSL